VTTTYGYEAFGPLNSVARQGHLRAPSQPLLPSSRPRRAPLQVAVPRANLDPGRLSRTVYTGGAAGLRGEARRAGQSG
jgi:hypothetical protein